MGTFLRGLAAVIFVAGLVGGVYLAVAGPDKDERDDGSLRIYFGYTRESLTRARVVAMCEPMESIRTKFSECSRKTLTNRPAIRTVTLSGDLVKAGGAAFPAAQLKVDAVNFDTQGISYTVTANPSAPEAVAPGTYEGTVIVARDDGSVYERRLSVSLEDRINAWVLYRVSLSLFLGALLGALLRWVADNVGKSGPTTLDNPAPKGSIRWVLAKFPGLIVGLATGLTVAALGITSQFLTNDSFANVLQDYLTLFLWAFGGQLAGQTLLDIAANTKASVPGTPATR